MFKKLKNDIFISQLNTADWSPEPKFSSFKVWSTEFEKTLRQMSLTKASQSDILENFERIKRYEQEIKYFGFELLYISASPQMNTIALELYPKNPDLIKVIHDNKEYRRFFETLNKFRRGQGYVSFDFSYLLENRKNWWWDDKPCYSILDYLCNEVDCREQTSFDWQHGYDLSAMHLVIAARRAASRGTEQDKQKFAELLFQLNLILIYFPTEAFENQNISIYKRLIIEKHTGYSKVPSLIEANNILGGFEGNLLVNVVYEVEYDDKGFGRLISVEERDKAIAILDKACVGAMKELSNQMLHPTP